MSNQNSSDLNKPSLVVFDLDCTLWPFHVEIHVDPPFSIKGSKVVDSRGKVVKCYPDVPEVLEYLKKEGISIGVASRTVEIDGAKELIRVFDWEKYFLQKEIYPGCKLNHFKKFAEKTGLPHSSMMFFDDEDRNIRDVNTLGVHCVPVRKGVTMNLVQDALRQFANNKSQQG